MVFNWKVFLATQWIKAGHVIAYPTESVYGLGCDPENLLAVEKLLAIKQRSYQKGLILVASNIEQMLPYMDSPTKQLINTVTSPTEQIITWLIPANKKLSRLLTGQHKGKNKTIALRLSRHPIISALCQQLGHPIVSTSANKTGKAMNWSALEVKQHFKTELKYILNAPTGKQSKPSEIRDIISGQIIRK